ncbi:Histidinol-phosphate aminotransferase [Brevundimonas subvibrioides]|uniref:aminotransferase class I/II-fold pyridoxal phosphate-dependent enzyme n=1 Tax=Brevundimonas subvibrioides TaxID=74313 RepID=UPI0032D58256
MRQGDGPAEAAIYDIRDFAAFGRSLYRHMPLPPGASILFESTVAEPEALLARVIRDAFTGEVTDRFESVFGRGNSHLLTALAARYGVDEQCILPTTGVCNGVAQVLAGLVAPGDHVLIETPGFDVLSDLARLAGAEVELLPRRGKAFVIDLDELRARLRPATRLVIVTNLHNPSGQWLGETALRDLAAVAATVGAHVLVDEVYADFARDSGDLPAVRLAPNLISVNSLTKVFGLFSLRCGWIVTTRATARRIANAGAGREFGVSKLTHAIGALVLETPEPFEAHWRQVLDASRPVVERHLAAMRADDLMAGDIPPYGCIAFPEVVGHADTRRLAETLWRDYEIVTAPGEFFGQSGHMRLGFGVPAATIDRGLSKLHEALFALRRAGSQPASPSNPAR